MKLGFKMSSFKRRTAGPTTPTPNATTRPPISLPRGTKLSPHHAQLLLTSTGMASLDGVMGGGLPIGAVGVILSDRRTSYAKTALNYYIGQGVLHEHGVALVSGEYSESLEGWVKAIPGQYEIQGAGVEPKKDEASSAKDDDLTIAWRYKDLPKLGSANNSPSQPSSYCHSFDLSKSMKEESWKPVDLHLCNLNCTDFSVASPTKVLNNLKDIIEQGGYSARAANPGGLSQRKILRIAIEAFGSPLWSKDIYQFLHGLKSILRHSFATALITFPAHLHPPSIGRGIMTLADLVAEFRSFADFPNSQTSEYHGMFYLHKTPRVNSLLNMGLRPTASGSGRTGAGGSTSTNSSINDLGFKLRRKKLVIETFHLPIEGGVSDRRTEPAPPKETSAPRRFTAANKPSSVKPSPIDF